MCCATVCWPLLTGLRSAPPTPPSRKACTDKQLANTEMRSAHCTRNYTHATGMQWAVWLLCSSEHYARQQQVASRSVTWWSHVHRSQVKHTTVNAPAVLCVQNKSFWLLILANSYSAQSLSYMYKYAHVHAEQTLRQTSAPHMIQ